MKRKFNQEEMEKEEENIDEGNTILNISSNRETLLSKESLEKLSKEELISLILSQKQVTPLSKSKNSKRDNKKLRPFDLTKYSQRHVAFKVAYFGWNFKGFVTQADTNETIEEELFKAFEKTRLIGSRSSCNYTRCGRTDKGVSALGQVIALNVRSNLSEGIGIIPSSAPPKSETKSPSNNEELNYLKMLNSNLPKEIRILSWTPVPLDFSARFSTSYRLYKYFFFKSNLDIDLMIKASQKLLGEHDFRNFCKMDVGAVSNFRRNILSVEINPVIEFTNGTSSQHQVYAFVIKGSAFLWHQVRCMVAILFLIGQHLEEPSVIDEFLNVEKNTKPNYEMASEIPLVLWECGYDQHLEWHKDPESQNYILIKLQSFFEDSLLKSVQIFSILDPLRTELKRSGFEEKESKYTKLMNRAKQASLEEKLDSFEKKKKKRKITLDNEEGE